MVKALEDAEQRRAAAQQRGDGGIDLRPPIPAALP